MAVITVVDIITRPFSGYEELRFPSGFWRGNGFSTGNGTGGDHSIQMDFNKATALMNSQFYSLENLMIAIPTTADQEVDLLIANFDRVAGVSQRDYTIQLVANERDVAAPPAQAVEGLRGMFLGKQTDPNSAQSLSLTVDNIDGQIITAILEGYVWGIRSNSQPGGPQRPPTGLYR